ncbi:MAG: CRTAC1 family protein [Candidatus Latescibacteria bacterium]|nr:CRTAC1 family protein [Candidatus Latescibacterota bacterium]
MKLRLPLSLVLVCMPLAAAAQTLYRDVTAEAGIHFTHSFGDEHLSSILEATGSGCLFFDYDRDGYMDLFAVNGCYLPGISDPPASGHPPVLVDHLFHNQGDGTFVDVTDRAGVGDPGYGMGCAAGDYDNDGDPDLYVTNYGPNTLYRNNGDGTFADVTAQAGVGDTLWGVGTTSFDYDLDGDLDLYVGNYLDFDPQYRLYYAADDFPGPLAYPGQPDRLYRNNGDGTFAEVSRAAGVDKPGRAMGVVAGDYDDDGDQDLFVANDAMEHYLYRNEGKGAFVDVALEAGVAFSTNGDASSSMGGDFADFDLDGDLDLLVPDMGFNNLYEYQGKGYYQDRTADLGVAELSGQYIGWHGDFLDCDNDGDLDLFIANGDAHRLEDTQQPLLLANVPDPRGGRRFQDAGPGAGPFFTRRYVARGGAAADYDNNGDLDLFVLNIDQPSVLLRNEGTPGNHWLLLSLKGRASNRDGIGARVEVRAGDLVQIAEKNGASGYMSQNEPRLHFGLGPRDHIDLLRIRWPSGKTQELRDLPADQVLAIEEPAP